MHVLYVIDFPSFYSAFSVLYPLLCTVLESEVEKTVENHPVDPKRGEERTLLAQNNPKKI